MTFRQIIILILLAAGLARCNVSGKEVTGNYVDKIFGDTLQMHADKSYDYLEQLHSGTSGLTRGKWEIKNRKVYFRCDHMPLVGYRLKVRPDTSSHQFQIKLLLADSEDPIHIEDVKILKNNLRVDENSFSKINNVVKVFTKGFDSIIVKTFNFTSVTFSGTLNTSHGYVARIYPVERLYELDKVPFGFHKGTLASMQTKDYDNIFLSFKKIKN